jgi:16S rRNA processing protein RimM
MGEDLIEIARVKGHRGLKGQIWITPYGNSFEQFVQYSHLIIGIPGKQYKVLSCMQHKDRYIVELEGIGNANLAEELKGKSVFVKRQWLPTLEKDEYYWHDLIGIRVVTVNGRELGTLVNIFCTGSNDVYVVDDKKQYFIPATADVIREVSLEKKIMVIDTSSIEEILD